MDCRLCGSGLLEEIFRTDRCPKYSHKYLAEREFQDDAVFELGVLRCKNCGLVQIEGDFPDDEYSSDYQRNISFSKSSPKNSSFFK